MSRDEIIADLRAAIERRQALMDGPDDPNHSLDPTTRVAIHSGAIAGMYYAISLLTEEACNTCGDTGRWETTFEDEPEVLRDIGPCPDCR